MAFLPGLKKQLNKANQFMSERITGVEGTKLDDDFQEMERRTDLFNDLVDDLQLKTKEVNGAGVKGSMLSCILEYHESSCVYY